MAARSVYGWVDNEDTMGNGGEEFFKVGKDKNPLLLTVDLTCDNPLLFAQFAVRHYLLSKDIMSAGKDGG